MGYRNMQQWIEALERAGELVRVREQVDPVLEITEIADRVSKARAAGEPSDAAKRTDPRFWDRGGHALLFENVKGSHFPLLINQFGSYRRMEMALGCEGDGFEGIAERIGSLVKPELPQGIGAGLAKARELLPLLRIGPKRRKGRGGCQEVVLQGDEVDLTQLPMLRCWPLDGDFAALGYPADVNDSVAGLEYGDEWNERWRGRYSTLAGIHTIHADDADAAKPASHNIGMYRVQLLGKQTMAMHWHVHHDGAAHWRSWKKRGEPMPVAIALGGESALTYAATAPLPPGISELLMAGFLNGCGVDMCRGVSVPLWVPANAEIVIEGYVSHEAGPIGYGPRTDGPIDGRGGEYADGVFEGPFGDHTGFYSMPDRYPVLKVTAITHRKGAVYPTTVVGLPPQEDYYMGKATERVFLPLLKTLVPDIEDYDLPMFGAFHNCVFVKIDKQYPMQARRVMHAIWGAGQMAWTKTIFLVDEGVDVHDHLDVLERCGLGCMPGVDTELVRGPLDILDHAAPQLGAGMKIGFDCTKRWEGDRLVRREMRERETEPEEIASVLNGIDGVVGVSVCDRPRGWTFVSVTREYGDDAHRLAIDAARACAAQQWGGYVVIVDDSVDVCDVDAVLFQWCANCDMSRDAVWANGVAVFDATSKRGIEQIQGVPVREWPPIIEMDGKTKALVDDRWARYGIPLS